MKSLHTRNQTGRLSFAAVVIVLSQTMARAEETDFGNLGEFAKWSTVEVTLTGPESKGAGVPNPFEIVLDVAFAAPDGTVIRVPGFYDGDGQGGLDGHVWKVRFSPHARGEWTFQSHCDHASLNGVKGTFRVVDPPADAPDFYRWGRLEAVGTPENGIRYLKFRDGPYWLKAGCDDPENVLGQFTNYDTPEKRRAAVDYLAERGINSMYVMTHNIGGDDGDVWPWLGATPREARANGGRDARFDVAKLHEWRELFEHMQRRGIVVYLVLEDDSAWTGYDHARYYRELVARFGDLPALLFNLGEEHNENYSLGEALEWMRMLEDIDSYDHPRGIHNVNSPSNEYVEASQVDFTSIQTGSDMATANPDGAALAHHHLAVEWIDRCRSRGRRVLMVGFDEGRPLLDRRAWWSAYMGGGVWEAHVDRPYDRPMSAWETVWTELGGTRTFMESVPFWDLQPRDDLVRTGQAFCVAKPGVAYAAYLPAGGSVVLELEPGAEYFVEWWNPANGRGGRFQDRRTVSGGAVELTPPGEDDWAVRIVKK